MRNLLALALLLAACAWESPTEPSAAWRPTSLDAQPSAFRHRAAGPRDVVVDPQCFGSAPLAMARERAAPGYTVTLDATKEGLNIEQLRAKYGFALHWVVDNPPTPAFSAEMSAQAVAGIRCEPNAWRVAQNTYGRVTNGRP